MLSNQQISPQSNQVASFKFTQTQSSENIHTLSQQIIYLLSNDHQILPSSKLILQTLYRELPIILHSAFTNEDRKALLEVHKSLYTIYEINFSNPLSPVCLHEHSPWLLTIRRQIENVWLNYEIPRIQKQLPSESEAKQPKLLRDWFMEQARIESDIDKCVLKFLKDQASVEQFNTFILSDATLNYRFCDTLALALLHFSETVKAEIVQNIWDESGHGIAKESHASQFTRMLASLGLEQPTSPIWENWQPYAGHNFYFCFGLNRKHYFKAIGNLAMPEIFDPSRNSSIIAGLERLYSDARVRFEYFYNHIEADEKHGLSWLDNVITPIVELQPEAGMELAIGGAVRMEAMRRYNQYLALRFGICK
ncbi:MAG: iron-containing redox enzyme family protein [Scytonematopsis contorta HA4267-MV1]|jgi:pyrroloquinoline quinone (PQQ) biosynthesis protein C|nr:iron-containing redox enzyme family protein [Scytonematopsis contorta HA4267-MV1]